MPKVCHFVWGKLTKKLSVTKISLKTCENCWWESNLTLQVLVLQEKNARHMGIQ